jgi:hypothetical protein
MGRIRAQSLGLEALGAHPALASYLTLEDVTRKRCFSLSRAIADAPRHIARYEPGLVPQRKSDFFIRSPTELRRSLHGDRRSPRSAHNWTLCRCVRRSLPRRLEDGWHPRCSGYSPTSRLVRVARGCVGLVRGWGSLWRVFHRSSD